MAKTKRTRLKKFIVENGLEGLVDTAADINVELQRYLTINPHPEYNIVSCQLIGGDFLLI